MGIALIAVGVIGGIVGLALSIAVIVATLNTSHQTERTADAVEAILKYLKNSDVAALSVAQTASTFGVPQPMATNAGTANNPSSPQMISQTIDDTDTAVLNAVRTSPGSTRFQIWSACSDLKGDQLDHVLAHLVGLGWIAADADGAYHALV